MPVGFRRGYAAVRSAQLNLARDKAVLEEQERQVIHDLSNALGDMRRAYRIMETTYNRRLAAQQNAEILHFRLEKGQPVTPEQLLEAERRLAEAEIQHEKSLVEHMLAIKNVHFEKGTLLEYGRIQLAEQLPMSSGSTIPVPAPAPAGPAPAPAGAAPARTAPATVPMPPQDQNVVQGLPLDPGPTIGPIRPPEGAFMATPPGVPPAPPAAPPASAPMPPVPVMRLPSPQPELRSENAFQRLPTP